MAQKIIVAREIEKLKQHLIEMSTKVEQSIIDSHQAFMDMDRKAAKEVMKGDLIIDEEEVDIEEECLKILALYQPVASELRLVVGILKMNNDLERMGDLAAGIAKCTRKIAKLNPQLEISGKFDLIFTTTIKMVKKCLDSLVGISQQDALAVIKLDDEVDELNKEIIEDVIEQMKQDVSKIDELTFLITISRNVERIGDYATNIAQDVYYMVTGDIIRHHSQDYIDNEKEEDTDS